jgi:hypothetical protein
VANATKTHEHFRQCADIVEIMEWVNGNGTQGAKTRMALIEGSEKALEVSLAKLEGTLGKIAWSVITAAITLTTGGLLWIFTKLIPDLLKGS